MKASQQFCTFHVGPLFVGLEIERVQEVLRPQPMTRVPLAAREVSGLINLRGRIVTALDLRRRLDLPDRARESQPMNVVVRTSEGVVSLLVDSVGDVVNTTGETFERPPETLAASARRLIRGVHKLPERLLLVLDADEAAEIPSA